MHRSIEFGLASGTSSTSSITQPVGSEAQGQRQVSGSSIDGSPALEGNQNKFDTAPGITLIGSDPVETLKILREMSDQTQTRGGKPLALPACSIATEEPARASGKPKNSPSSPDAPAVPEASDEHDIPDAPAAPEGAEPLHAPPPIAFPYVPPREKPSTEVPLVRQKLRLADIDPGNLNGIVLGIIDAGFTPDAHGYDVEAIVNQQQYGMIPNSQPQRFTYSHASLAETDPYVDKPNGLEQYISHAANTQMNDTNSILQSIVDKHDPALRVLNMSYAMSNSQLYSSIFNDMCRNPELHRPWLNDLLGEKKAQQWIDSKGSLFDKEDLNSELMKAIIERTDKTVANDTELNASREKFRDITRRAAENGIVICTGTGNFEDDMNGFKNVQVKPGVTLNWYGQSDHVISVGGSDINGTPGDSKDDKLAGFSSHGDDRHNPTVVAPGKNIKVRDDKDGVDGVSYSTPQVASTVALMLAQNPNLKFQEVKTMLQRNSSKLPGVSDRAQGAGVLNMANAIIDTRDSNPDNRKGS